MKKSKHILGIWSLARGEHGLAHDLPRILKGTHSSGEIAGAEAIRARGIIAVLSALRMLRQPYGVVAVSYTHLRAHETGRNPVCRLLLEKKKSEVGAEHQIRESERETRLLEERP